MLPDRFLAFINEHRLFNRSDRVLVAVSGGLDSMVLAHLLQQGGFSFGVAHVNFGLRKADSDTDAAFVENMARTYGVPFHLTRFDTLAESAQRGESTQVTARQLRYAWFRTLQLQHGYVAVATAHHLNDVLETMLLNLTRGTGLAGLRGMPIQADLSPTAPRLVRPLWFAPRKAIDTYAQQHKIAWREDSSNASTTYSRNKIRHRVIPVLEQINPGLLQALPRSLTQLRAAETVLQEALTASFNQCAQPTTDGLVIDVAALARLSEPLFRLGDWLRPYGFTTDVLAQCWQAIDPARYVPDQNGQVFMAPGHRLLHDRGQLWLQPLSSTSSVPILIQDWPTTPIEFGIDGQLIVERIARTDWDEQWPIGQPIALFDADTLPFPWRLRTWQKGDRFTPLGMNGSQLISDFLADRKIPLPEREHVWVLESDSQIRWVVGYRTAQNARLTANTRWIVRVQWQINQHRLKTINK
ncbi:tRNA lysidine(34) synthetase TilS [Fibrivirga algicola]|uniref:tRNA(Ile)-lysidine synthase n=1 Tax=Fibrivirga algicola TaxID=2950420 RepID=A0ABX0QA74_9BACT|nr:tRNA lysidine(34) synthetase TilS [Fibrivirga algicola]NID09125.1 tRNA lysidine(34) synthetase TilS [Fibrivirga algicola]